MLKLKSRKTLKRNHRGFLSHIQIAILAIAAMIIFSLFLYSVYINMKEKMAIKSCKASIATHDFVSTSTYRQVFTDIKCPTEEITIKNNNKAKEIIAEDMRRCWYIWGQGQGQYFKGEGSFCHICAIYQFGDKRKTITGFMKYLNTQPIKMTYPDDRGGMTYARYLMGAKTEKATEMTDQNFVDLSTIDTINTSQKYATIFIYASGEKAIQEALEGGNRVTVGTAGAFGVLGGGVAVGIGIFIASNPVGWVVGGVAAIVAGGAAVLTALHYEKPETLQQIIFRPYNLEELRNMSCEKIDVNQMSNTGTP